MAVTKWGALKWGVLSLAVGACASAGSGPAGVSAHSATEPCENPTAERLMTIEDVFGIGGRRAVVTGQVERGSIRVGDRISIDGPTGRIGATVKGVEMFRKVVEVAIAGDNIGLLLEGPTKTQLARGQTIHGCRR